MHRSLSALLLVLFTAAPALRAEDKLEGDLARLQGKWKAMAGPNKEFPIRLEIRDKNAIIRFNNQEGKEVELKGQIEINEKASPKTLDWVKFKRLNGDDAEPNLSIYKLEGDTLTTCNGGPGNDRPTEFKAGENGPPILLEFTRVKE